ncbi:MAG: asparagine synthase (glutamine-hydrolyzing) [Magnetococcales bacterium]|nr:asparagine synthase (glutamine-hydrolyzing) [Magnetococcales bacterium]
MCGIVGLFSVSSPDAVWSPEGLDAMVALLGHRGPDGWGKHVEPGLFFGHTRLAVLDLSSAGNQPMSSHDGDYILCFNGEIYNFRSLRSELVQRGHVFTTRTDTEVLLAAWVEWGAASLDRLDGIFAFALFDRRQRRLFLVRDHLGVKPLFFWRGRGVIAFASEPLALFGPVMPFPEPDAVDLDAYFTFNYIPAPGTGLRGVRQLEPGHYLQVSAQGEKMVRYWQLACQPEPLPWRESLVEECQSLVRQAVAGQMVADAPLGLFLSGGLDSTAVALSAHASGQLPTAFSLGFGQANFNELPAATAFAEHLGLPLRTAWFAWSEEEVTSTLGAMRELMADASCFPTFQLARFSRQQVTVILSGDGGDELLAGYDTYRAGRWTPWLRRIPRGLRRGMLRVAEHLPADQHRYSPGLIVERLLTAAEAGPRRDHASFRRIFSDRLKQRLYEPDFLRAVAGADPIGEYVLKMRPVPAERSILTACQYADLHHFLPSVLAKVDRMSMANGLEVRVPLLNRHLVTFCFQLPDQAKWYRGKGKRLLREMLAGQVPPGHLQRPKAGFLPPVEAWFRQDGGPMATVFRQHLEWARGHVPGWLRWDAVGQLWEEHQRGRVNAGFVLLGILQFINWQRQIRSRRLTPTKE